MAFAPCGAPPTRYPMLDRPKYKRQHPRLSGFRTSSACSLRSHRDRGVAVCTLRAPRPWGRTCLEERCAVLFRAPTLPGAHPMLLLADPCSCCSGMLVLTPRPCLQCPSSLATFSSTARPVAYGRRRPPPPSPHLRPRNFHPHHRLRHCRLRRRPHHHHPRRRRTAPRRPTRALAR